MSLDKYIKLEKAIKVFAKALWSYEPNADGTYIHSCPMCEGWKEKQGHYYDCPFVPLAKLIIELDTLDTNKTNQLTRLSVKDYGFILPVRSKEDLGIDCIERVKIKITRDGLNPNNFNFCQYGYIPDSYRDSFSKQFDNERIICTIAKPKI